MNHHVNDPMPNFEESSELSSAMFSATSRSGFFEDEKSDISSFFLAEERRENVAAETRSSNVRAMKEKFEQSPMSRDGTPKQRLSCGSPRLSCGSPISERKRQLQQSLFLAKDETPEVPVLQQPRTKKREDQYDGKGLMKSRRGKAFSALKKHRHMSRIADKKKIFEKKQTSTDDLSRDACTEATEGTTAAPYDTDHDATLTMTVSDSDLSALDYDGSLFSDGETPAPAPAVRDEVEATRRSQAPEKREVSEAPQRKSPEQKDVTYTTSLSPNNSFQEALHEIVQSFQDEASINKSRGNVAPPVPTEENHRGATGDTKHGAVYVMETSRLDDPSPVSMLTSFDTDTDPHGRGSSRGSLASGDMITNNPQGLGSIKEGASSPLPKATRDITNSEVLPNSSLFSTVEQEEERERAIAEQAKEAKDWGEAPFDEQFHEAAENESQLVEPPKAQAIAPQDSPRTKAVAKSAPKKEPEGDVAPTAQAPRYELAKDTQQEGSHPIPIKGILKPSKHEKIPLSPVSCVSSAASWYSSATSAASEISHQMAPHLQHTVPMMPNSRFSIGGYVNAHLAENPAKPRGGESNPSSRPQQCQNDNHQDSIRSHRQERRDSASSSVVPTTKNSEIVSPNSSMDPQCSESHQDGQDLQEIADAMSSMANTASTVVLDVLVDAADTVVLTPLLSIFRCVDQSESILCNGVNATEDCFGAEKNLNRRRQKVRKSRSRTRKFKA